MIKIVGSFQEGDTTRLSRAAAQLLQTLQQYDGYAGVEALAEIIEDAGLTSGEPTGREKIRYRRALHQLIDRRYVAICDGWIDVL